LDPVCPAQTEPYEVSNSLAPQYFRLPEGYYLWTISTYSCTYCPSALGRRNYSLQRNIIGLDQDPEILALAVSRLVILTNARVHQKGMTQDVTLQWIVINIRFSCCLAKELQ
jgi:hypothetical protein